MIQQQLISIVKYMQIIQLKAASWIQKIRTAQINCQQATEYPENYILFSEQLEGNLHSFSAV